MSMIATPTDMFTFLEQRDGWSHVEYDTTSIGTPCRLFKYGQREVQIMCEADHYRERFSMQQIARAEGAQLADVAGDLRAYVGGRPMTDEPTPVYREAIDYTAMRYRGLMREARDAALDGDLREALDVLGHAERVAQSIWTLFDHSAWERRILWARACRGAIIDLVVDRISEVGLVEAGQ